MTLGAPVSSKKFVTDRQTERYEEDLPLHEWKQNLAIKSGKDWIFEPHHSGKEVEEFMERKGGVAPFSTSMETRGGYFLAVSSSLLPEAEKLWY